MTLQKTQIENSHKLRSNIKTHITAIFVLTATLAVALIPHAMSDAAAIVVTNDVFISCGQNDWGTKIWQNSASNPTVFGRNTGCGAINPQICSSDGTDCRTNYIQVTSRNPGTSGGNSGWAAGMQGKDPWNRCEQKSPGATGCVNFGGANNRNSKLYDASGNYVLAADKAFQLGAQTYWFSDTTSKPDSGASGMKAWLLTDLWLVKTTESKINCNGNMVYPTAIVIDFSWAKLKQSGSTWIYDTAGDQDVNAPGTQYSTVGYSNPTCAGQTVYHFNIVLDSSCAVNKNFWCEVLPTSISTHINNAISQSYPPKSGSGSAKTPGGTSSNYKVADVESGIETWGPGGSTNKGTTKAAISRTTLQY